MMVANTMDTILSFEEEFKIYLNVIQPLVANLPVDSEKSLAARWVQKLISISDPEQSHLKLVYLKLLIHCLVRNKLLGPFMRSPAETLVCLPFNKKFSTIVEYELCEYSPCIVDLSADLLKYVAVQEMPRFGVHCYFAFSTGEKLDEWNNVKDINRLKGNHSFTKSKWVLPPLPKMKPLPDLVSGDQAICDCDKFKALEALEKLKETDEITALPLDHMTPIAEMIGSPQAKIKVPSEKTDSCCCSPKTPSGSIHMDMTQPLQDVDYTKPRSTHVMKWGMKRKFIKTPIAHEQSVEEERLEGILEASIRSETGTSQHEKDSIYNSEYFLENPPSAAPRTPPWRDAKRKLSFSESPTCQAVETPCRDRTKVLKRTDVDFPEAEYVEFLEDDALETPRPIYSSTPAVAGPSVDPGLMRTIRKDTPGPSRDPGLTHTIKKQRMDPTKTHVVKKAARRIHGPLQPQELDFTADITDFLDTHFAVPAQDVEDEERMLEADALWGERFAEWDASGAETAEPFEWIRGGRFDRRGLNTRDQKNLQKEFEAYMKERRASKIRPPQITDPTEAIEQFPAWVRDLQDRGLADERGRVIPEYHFPDPVYPPSRHPQLPATPPLFRRGTGHRDRRYRPSEFGLTETEQWIPAEEYMRESIEPIWDPDERALARLLRNLEDSLGIIEEESITFNDLEDTIPDWERPSWPQLNLQSTPVTLPPSTSTAIPAQPRTPINFLAKVIVPDDMLDPYEFRDQGPEAPDLLEMSGAKDLHMPLLPPPRKKNFFDVEDLIELPELESFQSEAGTSMFSSFEVGSLSSIGPIVPGKPFDLSDLEAFIDDKIEDISSYTIPLVEASHDSNLESLEVSASLGRHFQELKAAWQHLKENLSGIKNSSTQDITMAAPDLFGSTKEDIPDIPIENISGIPLEEMSRASNANRTLPSSGLSTPKSPLNVQAHSGMFDFMHSTELPPQDPAPLSYFENSNLSDLQSPLTQTPLPVRDYLRYQSPEPVLYSPIKIPIPYVPPTYTPPGNIFYESMDLVNSTITTEDYDQSNIISTTHSLVDSQEQMFVEDSSAEFGYKMPAVDRYKDLARRFAKIQSLRKRHLPLPSRIVEIPFSDAAPSHRLSFGGVEERRWPQLRRFSAPSRADWIEQQPSDISKTGSHYSPNVTGATSFNLEGLDVSLLEDIEKPSFYSDSEATDMSMNRELKLYMDSISDRENALKLMDILEESSLDPVADYETEHDYINFTDAGLQTSNDPFLDEVTMPEGGETFESIATSIGQQNYTLRASPKTPRLGLHSTPQSARHYRPIDYELPSIIRFEDSLPRAVTRDSMSTPCHARPTAFSSSIESRRHIENSQPPRRIRKSLTRPRRIDFVEEELSSINLRTALGDIENESEMQLELEDTGVQTEMLEQHIDRINNVSYISGVTEPTYHSINSCLSTEPLPKQRLKSRSYTIPRDADNRPTSKTRRYSYHYVPEHEIQNYLERNFIPQHEIFLDDESMPYLDSTFDEDKLIDMQLSGVTNYGNISAVRMPLFETANLASSVRSVPGTRSDYLIAKGYRRPQRRARANSLPVHEQRFTIEPKALPFWDSRISQKSSTMRRSHGTPESATQYTPPEYIIPSPFRFEVSETIPILQPATPTGRVQRMGEPRRMCGKPKRVNFTLDDIELSQPNLDIPLLEDESMPESTFTSYPDSLLSVTLPQSPAKQRRENTFTHGHTGANRYKKAEFNRSLPDCLQNRDLSYPDNLQRGQFNYSTTKRSILKPSSKYVFIDQESLPFKSSIDSTGIASLTLPSYVGHDSNMIFTEQPVFEEFSRTSILGQSDGGPFVTPKRSSNRRPPVSEAQTPRHRMQHSTPASFNVGGSYSFILPSLHRHEQSRVYTSPTPDPYTTPKCSRESPNITPRRQARRRLNLSGDTPTTFVQTLPLDPNFQISLIEDEMPMTPIRDFDNVSRSSAKYSRNMQVSDDGRYHVTPISLPDQTGARIQSSSPKQYLGSPVNRSTQNRSDVSRISSRRGTTIDSSQDDRCCVTTPTRRDRNLQMLDSVSPIQFMGSSIDHSLLSQRNPESFDLRRSPWHGIDSLEPDVSSIHTSRFDDSFWR